MLRTSLHLVFLSAVFVLSICGTCGLSPGRRTTKTLFTTTDSLSAATTLTDPGHQTHAIAPLSLFSTESDASVGPSPSMPRFQAASLRVDPCQPGFQFSDGECKACLPGSASPNGTGCVPCASGFYATLAGAPSCLACASGSVSGEWSTGCTQCGSGMIATSDHTKCIECPPGTWSRSGDTVCRECPVGTFNSLAAMPGCVDCGPGSYNPKPGSNTSSDCILCPGGSACTDSASSFPTPCDDTHYASAGAAECVACPKMFVSSSSRDSCQPTGVFYFVLACVLALVGLAIACVIQCPKKEWTAVDSVDPVL